jgi:predicted TIM-barrel fold metal-dependent hydrolase
MSSSRAIEVLLTLGALTATLACDKRPPAPQDSPPSEDDASTPTTRQESSTDDPQPSGENPTDSDAQPDKLERWKANDIHTHLGPTAYPVVAKILDDNDIFRVANMSGGHDTERFSRHLDPPDALTNRVAPFYTPDWENVDDPDFGEQQADKLAKAVRQGYAGLKISKALGLTVKTEDGEFLPVDTPKLDPLWERAGELGVPVLIHTADPKAFFEKPGPDNERWEELKQAPDWSFHGEEYPSRKSLLAARDRMVARHEDTTFILAHMANNPEDMTYVRDLLERHEHLYVDTAARVAEFGRHPSEQIRQFFIDFQDRILFGSDLGVHARARGRELYYSLFLGSISKEPPSMEDVQPFFDKHWRYFETDREAVEHPIPIQGDWKVHPINLPDDVLRKIYWQNSERLLFAPWLGRRTALERLERARSTASSE